MVKIKKSFAMPHKSVNRIVIIIATLLLIVAILYRYEDLRDTVTTLKSAKIHFLVVSVVFSALTYFAATMVYKLIAIKKLSFNRTLLVQIASSFTNRLFPAGIGGLATFARFLVNEGHSIQQSAALVTVNSIVGFVGLFVLVVGVALGSQTPLQSTVVISVPAWMWKILGLSVVVFVLVLMIVPKYKKVVLTTGKNVVDGFRLIAASPHRLIASLFFSMLITLGYAAALYFCIYAMGTEATVLQTLLVLTISVMMASVTPTPGGIGGAEAGMVAGLRTIGVPSDIGISIALLYRFVTFWLPIIPGYIAFQLCLKLKIL